MWSCPIYRRSHQRGGGSAPGRRRALRCWSRTLRPSSAAVDVGGNKHFRPLLRHDADFLPMAGQHRRRPDQHPKRHQYVVDTDQPASGQCRQLQGSGLQSVGGPVASSVATLTVLPCPRSQRGAGRQSSRLLEAQRDRQYFQRDLGGGGCRNNFNGLYGSASADGVPGPTPSLGFPGFESEQHRRGVYQRRGQFLVTLPP
jgi:hypothetical protein